MAVSFTRLSWWLWGGKEKETVSNSNGSSTNSSSDWGLGLREPEKVKFQSVRGANANAKAKIAPPSNRKVKRKWKSREERRIDREYDVVLVPSDGDYSSGSESDGLEWSIGWMEPHAPDFQSENEGEDSFAVLVPCYRGDCNELGLEPNNHFFSAIKNLPNDYSAEGKKYMDQWLSSLQNF